MIPSEICTVLATDDRLDVTSMPTKDLPFSHVGGIRISHPDRLIYPELGIPKIELARYFERVGDWILPHVTARPLTLLHCPDGLAAPCTYLKHAKAWGPNALRRVRIQEKTKVGPEVTWKQVVRAAELVRDVLTTLRLKSWVKTTGGRGIHVVVPLRPRFAVSACLDFSRAVAEAITQIHSSSFTTKFSKAGRERKILIDYLRNNRTNTSVCAFSTRARTQAPVSMPLDWDELNDPPGHWTLMTVPRRLARLRRDPWKDYWTSAQEITDASTAAVSGTSRGVR